MSQLAGQSLSFPDKKNLLVLQQGLNSFSFGLLSHVGGQFCFTSLYKISRIFENQNYFSGQIISPSHLYFCVQL